MTNFIEDGKRFRLTDPTLAPNSAAYLWNRRMMIQMNCRGYAVAQYMDPEPRKYAHVPTLAAQTFMQPEQGYFAHHPGRFFYVRNNDSGELISAPYEPVRAPLDSFSFEPGLSDIRWIIAHQGIRLELTLGLPEDDVLELWSVRLTNTANAEKNLTLVPFFPVGYASWMNQGGHFDKDLNAAICTSITPYQKVEQYFRNQHLKDITFFAADRKPNAYELGQAAFEGEGGLHNPSALQNGGALGNGDALYENAAGIMQFDLTIAPGAKEDFRFIFGPAQDEAEIWRLKEKHLDQGFAQSTKSYADYVQSGLGALTLHSPDETFNHFVNNWLPRQVFYHGDSNRLSTDPQTRNYLQDALGMVFIAPQKTREVILKSASQQFLSGKMPDGILLSDEAELKYINQIPHTDHGVWLVITTNAYLDETNDWAILDEVLGFQDGEETAPLKEHITRAMRFLAGAVDERGLPFIEQGDWCDPMNMVGYKGKGISGWLAEASSYALALWAGTCRALGETETAEWCKAEAEKLNASINTHLWDKDWYGRGITDDNVVFGVSSDAEGRIYLNAQSWALLCGAASDAQKAKMLSAIDDQLDTPYGVMMFAPAYTHMREDVGRVTQKWPGSAENGAVYNHAAAFYAAALYHCNEADRAFPVLRKMVVGANQADIARSGQIPLYVPNYFRGAYYQFPRTAGRSSNLFNTGTASWFYKLVIEQMCGIRGSGDGVIIAPQFPAEWKDVTLSRRFRGAMFNLSFKKQGKGHNQHITVNGKELPSGHVPTVDASSTYDVEIIES